MKSPARRTSLDDDESTGHRKKAICWNERGILTNFSHNRNLRQFFSIKTLTNIIILPARGAYDQKTFQRKPDRRLRQGRQKFIPWGCSKEPLIIIWQAPRAGKMNQIPCCDWLPERARWSDTARWDCPFCSRNNVSPKYKRVYSESLLSQNIFLDSKKIFCDFSVEMELENEKTETRYHFCI